MCCMVGAGSARPSCGSWSRRGEKSPPDQDNTSPVNPEQRSGEVENGASQVQTGDPRKASWGGGETSEVKA